MTTDITELAQRMKAAAVRAKAATEDYVAHRMSITVYLEECKEFNDLSDGPDNILALVEAVEKAQSAKRTLESLGYTDNGGELWRPPIGPKPNFSLMDSYRHRIAELESRTVTVKLSSERFRYGESDYDDGYVNGWNARMAEDTAALDRVGIKWEAE
ncbi:TPA: hypothetical protein ACTW38_004342 [Klebsiella michiganensis]|uniref:hypothetical protein n=1 Tax=Klebsiella sp. TaxID=576 RepID=UPI00258CA35F|nr:hypothetical protein [Klebsiella sp.]